MRTAKLILLAMLFAIVSVTLAHAGTQVKVNQAATVKATIKNVTNDSVRAAVKMTGYDDAGVKVGQLCKEAWLGEGRTTAIEYAWNAPAYATGVYWQAKVEVNGDCPNAEVPTTEVPSYRFESDSDSDSDADSDHD
jgi:trans-2-enoyl-CoA reductase